MSGSIAALFQRLTHGVYVVGVTHGEARNAFTAAWVMQGVEKRTGQTRDCRFDWLLLC